MGLSDREKRILKDLEKDLMSDESLQKAVQNSAVAQRNRNITIAIAGIVVGIILILTIALSQITATIGAIVVFISVIFLARTLNKKIQHTSPVAGTAKQ